MTLDRAGIERLVPHSGTMCLLDGVVEWDATYICCTAAAPGPGHPLARDGVVPAIAAIEYAAQATAVHGALLDALSAPRTGMLVKLGEVRLHTVEIPADGAALQVRAERLGAGAAGCLYAFELVCGHRPVAGGRLMIAFTLPSTP